MRKTAANSVHWIRCCFLYIKCIIIHFKNHLLNVKTGSFLGPVLWDGVSLDDAILNYIALNIKSNIRELEGALNKLVAYENLVQTEITMEIAEKELQNIISPDIPLEVTPQLVVEVVAEHFGITMDQITSKSRSNDVANPRQIAMYLCKNMTDASLETIGKAVGGRDHSTVVHGIKKVGDDISTDTSVERLVATIRKKINPH